MPRATPSGSAWTTARRFSAASKRASARPADGSARPSLATSSSSLPFACGLRIELWATCSRLLAGPRGGGQSSRCWRSCPLHARA
eukprot:7644064-Alexandrium_andersonii.AAC.1